MKNLFKKATLTIVFTFFFSLSIFSGDGQCPAAPAPCLVGSGATIDKQMDKSVNQLESAPDVVLVYILKNLALFF